MKKNFLIFLGIFILMFIPKNAYALDGYYPLNYFQKEWHDWLLPELYLGGVGAGDTSGIHSNLSSSFSYRAITQNFTTINNRTYGPIFWNMWSSDSMNFCTSNCDIDINFQFALITTDTTSTGRLIAKTYFDQVVDHANGVIGTGSPIVLEGTDIQNHRKSFICSVSVDRQSFPVALGPEYPWYYVFNVSCPTSNFKKIDDVSLVVDWWALQYTTQVSFYIYTKNLNYSISAYTGTQDGGGIGSDTNINNNINIDMSTTNQKLDNIDDTMKDDSIDVTYQNSTLNDLNSQMASNNVISDLLLLPVRMYQSILNSINGTCTPFNLGSLYGTTLIMPCIQPQNYIGSTLWGVIDILFCGFFILAMRKKFVDIFNNMTNLKNRGNELE